MQCTKVEPLLNVMTEGNTGFLLQKAVLQIRSHQTFCKGPQSKYFQLYRPYGVCHKYQLRNEA